MIEFTVIGEPVAKARPRVTRYGTYTPAKTKNYEEHIKLVYQNKYKSKQLSGPLKLELDIYMYIPKHTSKKRRILKENKEILPTKQPDWDNIAKSITDALNGLAYKDDKQIVDARVRKYFSEEMRVEVRLTEIDKEGV